MVKPVEDRIAEKDEVPQTDRQEWIPKPDDARLYRLALDHVRLHDRQPTAEEAMAMFREARHRYARRFCLLGEGIKGRETRTGQSVVRKFIALCRQVAKHVGEVEQLAALRAEVSESALNTLRECVAVNGAFDADPKLLKAKSDAAAAVLRICGHSEENKGKGAAAKAPAQHTHVNVNLGKADGDEVDERARLRRRLYDMETTN